MRVRELVPGMQFQDPAGGVNTFMAQIHHPYYTTMELVIWRMEDGDVSFDALMAQQELLGKFLGGDQATWTENFRNFL